VHFISVVLRMQRLVHETYDTIAQYLANLPEPAPSYQIPSRRGSNTDSENRSAKSNPKRKRVESTGDQIGGTADADRGTGGASANHGGARDEDEREKSPEDSTAISTEDMLVGINDSMTSLSSRRVKNVSQAMGTVITEAEFLENLIVSCPYGRLLILFRLRTQQKGKHLLSRYGRTG
jgi:hypothetical protein